jgi:hypothetical protein
MVVTDIDYEVEASSRETLLLHMRNLGDASVEIDLGGNTYSCSRKALGKQ